MSDEPPELSLLLPPGIEAAYEAMCEKLRIIHPVDRGSFGCFLAIIMESAYDMDKAVVHENYLRAQEYLDLLRRQREEKAMGHQVFRFGFIDIPNGKTKVGLEIENGKHHVKYVFQYKSDLQFFIQQMTMCLGYDQYFETEDETKNN